LRRGLFSSLYAVLGSCLYAVSVWHIDHSFLLLAPVAVVLVFVLLSLLHTWKNPSDENMKKFRAANLRLLAVWSVAAFIAQVVGKRP
jgi:uncharacterized membrane protein YfcA